MRGGRLVLQLAVCVAVLSPWADNEALAQDEESRGDSVRRGVSYLRNIRITPHYHTSVERLAEEQQVLVKDVLINAALSWLGTVLKVQPERSPLTFKRSCAVPHQMVEFKQYCIGACSEMTMCGPVPIPEEHLQPCRSCTHTNCTVSTSSKPVGVPDSDLVVYVSAISDTAMCTSQLVSGGHCRQESKLDRPIAAYLNFCPAYLVTSTDFYHIQIANVVQKVVQILAFSKSLFPFFRDEQGIPRNQRQPNGLPERSPLGNYVSDRSVTYYRHTPWLVANHVRSEVDGMEGPPIHPVRMVITDNVVREVQDHFNCSDMIGGELESQQGPMAVDSFWEKRVFGEEVMTASPSYHPVLSRLTLALLHDSGWYLPDYSYGGQLHWGRGMGCSFIEGSCYKWLGLSGGNSIFPFCRRVRAENCVAQRRAIGVCNIKKYPASLPEEYQYFPTPRRGGFPLSDFCPLFQYDFHSYGRNCMTAPKTPPILPEVYGPESRCFEHDWGRRVGGGAGCYSYQCTRQQVLVSVGPEEVVCEHAGEKKSVEYSLGDRTYRGKIVCPAYDEVCENYDCPAGCSGHGSCDRGHCRCQPGYYGDDCSYSYLTKLLSCNNVTCHNGGSCIPNANGTRFGFTCECPANYTGMFCETEDPCHNITCSESGNCTWSGMEMVGRCECVPGYGGDDCSKLLLCEEQGRPCKHGYCAFNDTKPVCVCDEGYQGLRCNRRTDPCMDACLNGGTCSLVPDSSGNMKYNCSCTPGFKGRRCGKRKDPCRNPYPCLNGGWCVRIRNTDEWGQFYCECQAWFTGQLCEIRV